MLRQRALSVSPHRQAQLAEHARSMRMQMTPSEAALWRDIRAGQLGVTFRRQYVIAGRYIADFAAPAVRLVVEVDGGYHGRRVVADERRNRALEWLGWRMVRIPSEVVLRNFAFGGGSCAGCLSGGRQVTPRSTVPVTSSSTAIAESRS